MSLSRNSRLKVLLAVSMIAAVSCWADTYEISIETNWNALTCEFSGTNLVTTDLGLIPESGDQMLVFDLETETFSNFTYEASSWLPNEPALTPGQGALYFSQRSFVWTVTGVDNSPLLPLTLPPGVDCLVGAQTNVPATFDQIAGFTAPSGTLLFRLIPGATNASNFFNPSCFLAYTNVGGVWQPSTPVADVGEAVFIDLLGAVPMIVSQPQGQNAQCGEKVVFKVGVTGAPPLAYQWFSNNAALSGETNALLALDDVTLSEAASYSVIVSNSFGTTNSLPGILTLLQTNPPVLVCPSNVVVGAQGPSGSIVNYSVSATGTCLDTTIVSSPPSGSMFPIGTTIVEASVSDTQGNSNSCFFEVDVLDAPDLSISISSQPSPAILSNIVTFSIIVTNAGPGMATNASAEIYLPEGIDYVSSVSSEGSLTETNGAVAWQLPVMNENTSALITIVGMAAEESVRVFATATVSSANGETNLVNNVASALTTVVTPADLFQPFWFESTIISNGQFDLTLAGPVNQVVEVETSTDLLSWSFAFNVTLDGNGIGSASVPIVQSPPAHYFRALYVETLFPPTAALAPGSQTADTGDTVTLTAQVGGTDPLSLQWMLDGTNLIGQTAGTLVLENVTTNDAGTYTLVVSNAVGGTNATTILSVSQWNYGIAPDPPYPTLLASGGARHLVVAGFCLGSIESTGLDAMPESENFLALTPLPAANDGVLLPAMFVPNQPAQILVIASAPGLLDAWIDYNGDGAWGDTIDQISASYPLQQGTNTLSILVPPTAVPGESWARFRFSSAGGLSYSGDAEDGEVEDYPVTISASPSLALAVTASPDPVAVGGAINYVITVTGTGPVPAYGVVLNDIYPAGVTAVTYTTSQGTCISNNGTIVANLGTIAPNASATVDITVISGESGGETNAASVTASEPLASSSTATVVSVTSALIPPSILSGPTSLGLELGDSTNLCVSASGSAPLYYQWFQNGLSIPSGTASMLPLYAVTASNAGSYTVVVSNAVGSVMSTGAVVTVQQQYDIDAEAGGGGMINPEGDTLVNAGTNLVLTALADPGYTVDSWYVDGTAVATNQAQYTLTNIDSDHAVYVTFDNSTNYDPVAINGPWYYDTNGIDLGTNWSQPGYDFSGWSNGPALFAPPAYAGLYPVPFGTPLDVGDQTTFYFLREFQWYGSTPNSNLTFTATCYITSGAVFYLNGVQVGQVRMTNYPVTYDSLSAPQPYPGTPDILTFPSTSLVTGTNILAVEVHQADPANQNVAFAMDMEAQQPVKPTVVINPTQMILPLGGATMTIKAQGKPVAPNGYFQWTQTFNGLPAAQATGGITAFVTSRNTNNATSTASVMGSTNGLINLQVVYQVGNVSSEPAFCTINVVQAAFLTGGTNGSFNSSASAQLFNPSPIVVLDAPANPGTGPNPMVKITGTVTSFLAPIAADHIFINGKPAASTTLTGSGPNNLGPFTQTFASPPLSIGNDDYAIVAAAVNSLNNVGYQSFHFYANRGLNGAIVSRTMMTNPSVPAMPASLNAYLGPYQCQLQVNDAKAAASKQTVTVAVDTGVDTKNVTLTKGTGNVFTSPTLFYVPANLALPGGTAAAVTASRIKAQFGNFINVTYQPAGGGPPSTTQIVPTGVLLVQKGAPMNFIQSGVAADVTAASADIPFTIQAGIDTRFGAVNSAVTLTSLTKFGSNFAMPMPAAQFAPVQLAANVLNMTQASTNPASPLFNLYTNNCPPIMAIRRRMPLDMNGVQQLNAKVTPITVNYRGYVSANLAATGAANIEPVLGLGFLVANPSSLVSTNLNPPLIETDFLPEFNPNPIVLITSAMPMGQANFNPPPQNVALSGQVIDFMGPMVQANITVNGTQVTTFAADANSPSSGPWRATFTHTFPIDPQMPFQVADVAEWDPWNNFGESRIGFTAVGGGVSEGLAGTGAAVPITALTPGPVLILPTNPVVGAVVTNNSLPLGLAMSVLRNNQFRIEANPILCGPLDWMYKESTVSVKSVLDTKGTPALSPAVPYGFSFFGGGASTQRIVVIPDQFGLSLNALSPLLCCQANPGVFLSASLSGMSGSAVRPAFASPVGASILQEAPFLAFMGIVDKYMQPVETVVPGNYGDVGRNPEDIDTFLRVGANGFDPASGAGRTTLAGSFTSLNSTFTGNLPQPNPRRISRNDPAPPPGSTDRAQWENFPVVTQNLTLTRASDDPTSALFNLFEWLQTPAPPAGPNEQPMVVISTGTFPTAGAAGVDAATLSGNVLLGSHFGLQFADPATWVQFQCAGVPSPAVKPVYGANFSIASANAATQTDPATGNEVANNFSAHRDFAVQLGERPITLVGINPGPPTGPAAAPNFWLRVERPYVDAASDLVPNGESGNQVVAYIDTSAAAGFQAAIPVQQAGHYRFPPSGAAFASIIQVGTANALEAPKTPDNVPLRVSQNAFEGVNMPDIAIAQNNPNPPAALRRALPPGRYFLRPVMQSPTGAGRYILGRAVPYTVPLVTPLVQLAQAGAAGRNFANDMQLYGFSAAALYPPLITQFGRVARRIYGTGTSANNRDVYVAGAPDIRIVAPGTMPQPAANADFVVPVNFGGNGGIGSYGGANTRDVLNNLTDEGGFTGGGGIFTAGFIGQPGSQTRSIFQVLRATSYGSVGADNVANLVTALNTGLLSMPAGTDFNPTTVPAVPPVAGQATRDMLAMNAATAMTRAYGGTTAHEIGHTLGLVPTRLMVVNNYFPGNMPGVPITAAIGSVAVVPAWPAQRADFYHVGSDIPAAQFDHEGQIIPKPGAPPVAPPAGTTQVAGVLPSFREAAAAIGVGAAPPNFGVSALDDLSLIPVTGQNFLMDAGVFRQVGERTESADSNVQTWPKMGAAQQEPVATFTARDTLVLQAELPRE